MKKTAGGKLPPPREETEQIALFTWAEFMQKQHPELALMHHIPNGGWRNPAEAAKFKRMGVKAGIPDIFLPLATKTSHGLYLELKRKTGGRLSEDQKAKIELLRAAGYRVEACKGFEEARKIIEGYLREER